MIRLRPLAWPADRDAVLGLDTSYSTDRVFALELTKRSVTLAEHPLPSPIEGSYQLDADVETLPHFAWVRVAEDRDGVVGLAAVARERWNRRARLEHLYVTPPARGRGVGRALVEAAVEAARALGVRGLWVETQPTNYGAVRFYERTGFVWCGLDTSLYDVDGIGDAAVGVFFWRAFGDGTPAP